MSIKFPLVLSPFDKEDLKAMHECIDSGQWTMGPAVRQFEEQFSKICGSRFAVMVNSGSSANLAAVTALLYGDNPPLKRGDEVLVPAIGWSTTWAPLEQLGLVVRVVDVNPETLNVDVSAIERAITPKTKMVMTVTVLGNPIDFSQLLKLCRERNLLLLEDNCESIGATHNGKWCGTFGCMGTFSFFYSHHISTIEGGMVVTDDEKLYHLLLAIRAHGWNREIPKTSELNLSLAERMKQQYQFVVPGYNLRPMEISGVLGLKQLPKLNQIIEIRRQNARYFLEMMKKHDRFRTQICPHGDSSWYAFTMILKSGTEQDRNRLFEHLSKNGIESRMITGGSFEKQRMERYFSYTTAGSLKFANEAHDLGLFVANHGVPILKEIDWLDHCLTQFERD